MPRIEITMPTFHAGQIDVYRNRSDRNAVRCGRRFGKTKMMEGLAINGGAKGRKVGLFTPEHKQWSEPYVEILSALAPLKTEASKTAGIIRLSNGGQVDFWSLIDNELAGRGREYDIVLVDEAAFTKPVQMQNIWSKSIEPTMATRPNPVVWVFSTPNGNDPTNFFYDICRNPESKFKEHYAPSSVNPLVKPDYLEEKRREVHPMIFKQEYLAEFVDFSGDAFFLEEWLLENGQPVAYPTVCDAVFAIMDTAVKAGSSNDGTAVSYWASSQFVGHPLVCLDWELVQIEGATLENWIPTIRKRLEDLARECRARFGIRGIFIEDAQSGSILLQQCAMRGIPAEALPQKQTSLGKDGRAWNASGAVAQGKVKWSRFSADKRTVFKGASQNHMESQVYGFRMGDKDAAKRSDDLLDTFCYAVIVALGNSDGVT